MLKLKTVTCALITCLSVSMHTAAFADRGMISTSSSPTVMLFEPRQNAIIAWNGEEEILVLTTDVHASQPVEVLEMLPLPAEPKVSMGQFGTLTRAIEIINKHQPPVSVVTHGGATRGKVTQGAGEESYMRPKPAGAVTFQGQIGHHDVTVTKVLNADRFVSWVETTLTKMGGKNVKVPPWMKARVDEYSKEGVSWFVFDSVVLGTTPQSTEPIRYRFKTKQLFYPLKITRVTGESEAQLVIMTSEVIKRVLPPGSAAIVYPGGTIAAPRPELEYIDPEITELIAPAKGGEPVLGIWDVYSVGGRGFNKDLLADYKPSDVAPGKAYYSGGLYRHHPGSSGSGAYGNGNSLRPGYGMGPRYKTTTTDPASGRPVSP